MPEIMEAEVRQIQRVEFCLERLTKDVRVHGHDPACLALPEIRDELRVVDEPIAIRGFRMPDYPVRVTVKDLLHHVFTDMDGRAVDVFRSERADLAFTHGKLIVLHDPVFGGTYAKGKPYEHTFHDALTNGPVNVPIYERTLLQIQQMRIRRVGTKGNDNRIPLFTDYLNLCEKYSIHPVIDLSAYSNEPARQELLAVAVAKEIRKRPKSKKLVLALPGSYKVLAKALGVNPATILFKYDIDQSNRDTVGRKYRALLNDVPYPAKLANWSGIKNNEWFK